jgi:hypothetical protein
MEFGTGVSGRLPMTNLALAVNKLNQAFEILNSQREKHLAYLRVSRLARCRITRRRRCSQRGNDVEVGDIDFANRGSIIKDRSGVP